jgi:hypothetical protein
MSSMTEPTEKSPARKRFDALVLERKPRMHGKERSDFQSIYAVASLRQILEQLGAEISAGVVHDEAEIIALHGYANEMVVASKAKVAAAKPKRFRGLGR